MPDLKDEKWLWLKGGLLVILGCLSAWFLIIELRQLWLVAVLALTIWAFCRAYYFAFYVIEKYIDSEYRFAGLLYLPQYWWHRSRGTLPQYQADATKHGLSWYLFWPIAFLLINTLMPPLWDQLVGQSLGAANSIFTALFGGVLESEIAFLAFVMGFGPMAIRYRVPLCLLGTALFAFAVVEATPHNHREMLITIVFASIVTTFSASMIWMIKKWMQVRVAKLPIESDALVNPISTTRISQTQWSIRYIAGSMVCVAFLCLFIRYALPNSIFPYDIWLIFLAALLPTSALAIVGICLIGIFLQQDWTRATRLTCIFALVVGVVLVPSATYIACTLLYGIFDKRMMTGCMSSLIGFIFSWSVILLNARSRGYRLISNRTQLQPSQEDPQHSSPTLLACGKGEGSE